MNSLDLQNLRTSVRRHAWMPVTAAMVMLLAACKDDDPPADNPDTGADVGDVGDVSDTVVAPTGTIAGTVVYEGTSDGLINVVVFDVDPTTIPQEEAVGRILANVSGPPPTFDFAIDRAAGDYWVLALFDVNGDFGNNTTDPLDIRDLYDSDLSTPTVFDPVTVVEGQTNQLDFTLGAGTVAGVVSYDGTRDGDVLLAAYENFPPGPGEGPTQFSLYEDAVFPIDYRLNGVVDGTYTIVALFDIDGDDLSNFEVFGVSAGSPVTIDSAGTTEFMTEDITLQSNEGSVSGVINYPGDADGNVLVGLFANFPPLEGELPVANFQAAEADFPLAYEIDFVSAGAYTIIATYDIGGDDQSNPELTVAGPTLDFTDDAAFTDIDFDFPDGTATINGNVTVAGGFDGQILVGAFANFPPAEGESPVSLNLFDSADLPADFSLTFVNDGTYTIAALFDIDADDLTDPEVFATAGAPVTVDADNQLIEGLQIDLVAGPGTVTGAINISSQAITGAVGVVAFAEFPPTADSPIAGISDFTAVAAGDSTATYSIEYLPEGTYSIVGLFTTTGDPTTAEVRLLNSASPLTIPATTSTFGDVDFDFDLGPRSISGQVTVNAEDIGGAMIVGLVDGPAVPGAVPIAIAGPFAVPPGTTTFDYDFGFLPDGSYTPVAALAFGETPDITNPDLQVPADMLVTLDEANPTATDVDIIVNAGNGSIAGTLNVDTDRIGGLGVLVVLPGFPANPLDAPIVTGPIFSIVPGTPTTIDYTIDWVPTGDYTVALVLDADANGFGATDPVFPHLAPVAVASDALDVTAVDIDVIAGTSFVNGTIAYDGNYAGPLSIGLFESNGTGPVATPTMVIFDAAPDFGTPVEYAFNYAPDGDYFVVAGLDVESEGDGVEPAFEIGNRSGEITLDDTTTDPITEDLVLSDPCVAYCATYMATCGGQFAEFGTLPACIDYCEVNAALPLGNLQDVMGNSANCRLSNATVAGTVPSFCSNATATGGNVCGTYCENYCHLSATNCTGANEIYADDATCMTACAAIPVSGTSGDTSGNTLQCRIYHLSVAGVDAVTHCPHGEVVSSVCAL